VVDAAVIREALARFFSAGELRTLCFDLGLDYDNLPGEGKEDKAREMVAYFERRDLLLKLVEAIAARRPNLYWTNAANDAAVPPAMNQAATSRMLLVTVGRLEVRQNRLERQVDRLRALTAAQLTATLFLVLGFVGLLLVLLLR
jgi:hypothetical protein